MSTSLLIPNDEHTKDHCPYCSCAETISLAQAMTDTIDRERTKLVGEQIRSVRRIAAALRATSAIALDTLDRDDCLLLDAGIINRFLHEVGQYLADLHIFPLTDPEISIYQVWQDMEQALSEAEAARRASIAGRQEPEGSRGEAIHTTLLNFFLPDRSFYSSWLVHSSCQPSAVDTCLRAAIKDFLTTQAGGQILQEDPAFTWHDALEHVPPAVFARHGILCLHPVRISVEENWDENLAL